MCLCPPGCVRAVSKRLALEAQRKVAACNTSIAANSFLLVHFIESKQYGFGDYDRKNLSDLKKLIPAIILAITLCNVKFDLLVTVPMILICSLFFDQFAFTTDDGNMSCYSEPELFAQEQNAVLCLLVVLMISTGFFYKKNSLLSFVEREKSKKQHD